MLVSPVTPNRGEPDADFTYLGKSSLIVRVPNPKSTSPRERVPSQN